MQINWKILRMRVVLLTQQAHLCCVVSLYYSVVLFFAYPVHARSVSEVQYHQAPESSSEMLYMISVLHGSLNISSVYNQFH